MQQRRPAKPAQFHTGLAQVTQHRQAALLCKTDHQSPERLACQPSDRQHRQLSGPHHDASGCACKLPQRDEGEYPIQHAPHDHPGGVLARPQILNAPIERNEKPRSGIGILTLLRPDMLPGGFV